MKVFVNGTTIMTFEEVKKEIKKIKKLESDLSMVGSFDYLEGIKIQNQLQEKRGKLENIINGIKRVNIESDNYELLLYDGYYTYNLIDDKRDTHDYGTYNTKQELLEAINNISVRNFSYEA